MRCLVSGVSVKELQKFSQDIISGDFKKVWIDVAVTIASLGRRLCSLHQFDYGRDENIKRYGSPVPPAYNLTAITKPPIAFFYGEVSFDALLVLLHRDVCN